MPETSDKMQFRAALMSILNKYSKNPEATSSEVASDIEELKKIPDKDFVCKILLKEISNPNPNYANICAIFLMETIDNKTFEEHAINALQDSKIPDEKKFFIISILKQKGISFKYDEIAQFIKHPEKIAQDGVKDFLINAIDDPEVQIDLLDFYQNIPTDEKLSLLANLEDEFEGDDLVNALSLIAQLDIEKEEFKIVFSALTKTNSPYAIEGLNYILKNYEIDLKEREKAEKALKKLKLEFPDFKNTGIIKDSKIHKCYISFADGNSNFSLVASRIHPNGMIDTAMITINLLKGIISCMGFGKIKEENFASIIKRLFADTLQVEINPIALKSLAKYYYEKNQKIKTVVPYEFIVWKNILNDVQEINYDISEFINSKLETINLNQTKVKKLASSKMLENWFYTPGQNEFIDKIIEKIELEHITELEKINEIVSSSTDKHFLNNNTFLIELQSRLLIQAYVAKLAGLKISSAGAYSLCFKNPYLKFFISSIIDKSLYFYFQQNSFENNGKNLFKRETKTGFSKDELQILMSQFEEKWN